MSDEQAFFPPGKSVNANIEIKARLHSIDSARRVAAELATARIADEHQVDTYFVCQTGRLKLREINGESAQLIWYLRTDQAEAKPSRYLLAPVAPVQPLKLALSEALRVRVVVDKQREIYLVHNVRIHLDTVRHLGSFLELEAVQHAGSNWSEGYRDVAQLSDRLQVKNDDLCPASYGDLLLAAQSQGLDAGARPTE